MPPPMINLSHCVEQVLDDQNLVADLRAAQNGDVGMLGVGSRAAQIFQFLFHQETGHGHGQLMRDAFDAGVRAVRRTERVAHVHFAQRRQLLGEFGIVLFLFLVEADIFQQQHFAGLQRLRHRFDFRADAIGRHLHGLAQQLRQRFRSGLQAELGFEAAPLGRPRWLINTSDAP